MKTVNHEHYSIDWYLGELIQTLYLGQAEYELSGSGTNGLEYTAKTITNRLTPEIEEIFNVQIVK